MQRAVYILPILCTAAIAYAIAAPVSADESPLVRRANAWTRDQPVPAELLTFRESDGCIAEDTDTDIVFSGIANYDLLKTIISQPCDERVFECADGPCLSSDGLCANHADDRCAPHVCSSDRR